MDILLTFMVSTAKILFLKTKSCCIISKW